MFNRKIGAIHAKARSVDIRKSEEYISEMNAIGSANKYRDAYRNNPELMQLKVAQSRLNKVIEKNRKKQKHEFKGYRRWSDAEKKFLMDHYELLRAEEIAKRLGRSYSSVISIVRKMRINGQNIEYLPHRNYADKGNNGRFIKKITV